MEEPIPECPLRVESFTTRSVVGALLFYDWRACCRQSHPAIQSVTRGWRKDAPENTRWVNWSDQENRFEIQSDECPPGTAAAAPGSVDRTSWNGWNAISATSHTILLGASNAGYFLIPLIEEAVAAPVEITVCSLHQDRMIMRVSWSEPYGAS